MIKITCVECGKKIEAPDNAAGKKGRCPCCRTVFDVPGVTAGEIEVATVGKAPGNNSAGAQFLCLWCNSPVEVPEGSSAGEKITCPSCEESNTIPSGAVKGGEKSEAPSCLHCGAEVQRADAPCPRCGRNPGELAPEPEEEKAGRSVKEPEDNSGKDVDFERMKKWVSPSTGMEFVRIDALEIMVGKYEVTNGEYRKKERYHSSGDYEGFSLNGDRQPVVEVNFLEAKQFAEWMTMQDRNVLPGGYRYRLPSEEEWIVFAQCGDGRRYPWGNNWPPVSGQAGNYRDETARRELGEPIAIDGYDDGFAVSAPVDELWENPWGLRGAGGNAWELCAKDHSGESFGAWRGADWHSNGPGFLRCTYRDETGRESLRNYLGGFRLVLSHEEEEKEYRSHYRR